MTKKAKLKPSRTAIPKATVARPFNKICVKKAGFKDNHLHDVHHACTHVESCSSEESHIHNNKEKMVDERVTQAKKLCQQQGVRFTALRQLVYRLILQADKPVGAYDLLKTMQNQALQKEGDKAKNIAPPTVYRSLEFLLEEGFIHQLTSINAFIPCCHPRDSHLAGFLICTKCDRVQEYSNNRLRDLVNYTNDDIGFTVENTILEMTGVCRNCQA